MQARLLRVALARRSFTENVEANRRQLAADIRQGAVTIRKPPDYDKSLFPRYYAVKKACIV